MESLDPPLARSHSGAARADADARGGSTNCLAVLGLVPPLVHALLVFGYAVDFPYWEDDLAFLSLRPEHIDWLPWLARSHNEHRLFFSQAIAESANALCGEIDFRRLIWIGNALLYAFWISLIASFRRLRTSPTHFAVVTAILFAPAMWTTITWATSTLQNNGVLLLSFCSLAAYRPARPVTILVALSLASLATFTSASGLFLFPVLLAWVAANALTARRTRGPFRWTELAQLLLVIAAASGTALLFFHDHPDPTHRVDISAAVAQPVRAVARTLAVLGSALSFQRLLGPLGDWTLYAPLLAGTLVVVFAAIAALRSQFRGQPLLLCWMTYLALTAASIGAGRADAGVMLAFAPRYATLSAAAIVGTYLAWTGDTRRVITRKSQVITLSLAAAFWMASMVENRPRLAERHSRLAQAREEWPQTGDAFYSLFSRGERAARLVRTAVDAGRFSPD